MKEHDKQTGPLTFTLTKTKSDPAIDLKAGVSPKPQSSQESKTNAKEKK